MDGNYFNKILKCKEGKKKTKKRKKERKKLEGSKSNRKSYGYVCEDLEYVKYVNIVSIYVTS